MTDPVELFLASVGARPEIAAVLPGGLHLGARPAATGDPTGEPWATFTVLAEPESEDTEGGTSSPAWVQVDVFGASDAAVFAAREALVGALRASGGSTYGAGPTRVLHCQKAGGSRGYEDREGPGAGRLFRARDDLVFILDRR